MGLGLGKAGLSVRPAIRGRNSVFVGGMALAFAVCSAPPAARAADAEAVTIDTTFKVFTPPVRLDKPARTARASVILMTGGNGLLSLDATGTIINNGNFLIRSADLFLRTAQRHDADAAPAAQCCIRLSATRRGVAGFHLAAVNRWGKPVWWSAPAAVHLDADAPDSAPTALGVVLTSPVTVVPFADQATFNLYASRITLPAVVVWHRDDHCSFSPPAGSAILFTVIPSAGKAQRSFEHGHSVAADPCGPFSEHGYAGIEEEVVVTDKGCRVITLFPAEELPIAAKY